MTVYVTTRIYVDVADVYATAATDATYATAREATIATGGASITSDFIGQRFSGSVYQCAQYFPILDTSGIPAAVNTATFSFRTAGTTWVTGDTMELRQASSSTTTIAGSGLAVLPLFGSWTVLTTVLTRRNIALTNVTSMTRSATCPLLFHSQKQRLGTAPTGVEWPGITFADQSGTTNDQYLEYMPAPWSFVGVSTAVIGTATSLTLTEPAGVADGDLLIACIASRTTATTAVSNTGWTAVNSQNNNNILTTNAAVASGTMLYRVRAGTPDLTFDIPAGISVAMGQIVAYRGNATTTPLDTSSAVTTAIATTNYSVAGLTTTQDDDLIVAMSAGGQEATWVNFNATSPSGGSGATDTTTAPSTTAWAERFDQLTTTGVDTSLGIFDAVKATAGATGNFTGTASVSASHVFIAGAFKIAPSGPAAYNLPATAGSYALTGAAATLTKSGLVHHTLAADGSTYVLTGTAATLTKTTPPTADAWNKDDKSSNITLSASDKAATLSTAVTGGVRSTQKYLNGTDTGKYYAEFLLTNVISGFSSQVGIREVSAALNASSGSTFQCASNSGNILTGSATNIGNIGGSPLLDGDVICMAWSPSTERGWFRKNGDLWNNDASADPATNTNGLDISVLNNTDHALFFLAAASANGAITTLRTELAEYTQTVPAGFTSWMGESTGPTAYTLPAVAGSYALTGTTAGVYWGREVLAVAGSHALTGATASLEVGREVAAVAGSYALTGTTASLELGREISALGGSYALGGNAATLLRAWKASAVSGSYSLTGADATLTKGTPVVHRTLPAAAGTYAVSGTVASLEVGREVLALPGTYALTGQTASLELGREVLALAGSYALAGATASLERGREVAADPGSYALTGVAANLERGREVAADAGSYALLGTVASLELGREVVGLSGSYALFGQPATFARTWKATAVSGAYALTGLPVNLLRTGAYAVIGLPGSYTLTGTPASLLKSELAGLVGVWNGSTWVNKPAKVWTGSAWVQKPVKHWDGLAWVA